MALFGKKKSVFADVMKWRISTGGHLGYLGGGGCLIPSQMSLET